MTIDEIIQRREELSKELTYALSTMVLSNRVREIKNNMKAIQAQCPHQSSKYNWEKINNKCPYCGKEMEE